MELKAIIWDLDDTLWRGTLADGEAPRLDERRAALVRRFNQRGVINAICSNNDHALAQAQLERFGLWGEFVFARIAFAPKPGAIRQMIADMQLRPANVLFVDDNPHNLEGARHLLPELAVLDARAPEADLRLEALLAELPASGRSRVGQYRALEARLASRAAAGGSNEEFLHACGIHATAPFLMDNLDFSGRIAELVNRSNQLNYTASRVEPRALAESIIDVVANDSWSIFAWDRHGDHGLVGFVQVDRQANRLRHFAFSCRIMHMGLEQYALAKVAEKWPACDLSVLAGRVPATPAGWIRDVSFHAPEVRERLIAALAPAAAGPRDVRVMFDCQSGGIAHFSRHRGRLDFDNNPRLFALRHLIPGADEALPAAPLLVYGAGIDYSDPRWPELADLLEHGLYEACVGLMCEHVAAIGARALVILPPEDAPEAHYRPHMGHTRARTAAFNALWRTAAETQPWLALLEMTGFARADEMRDVSHFHARLLQRLAAEIDAWLDAEAPAVMVRKTG